MTVHMGIPHPMTGLIGSYVTPTSQIATTCQENWSERPRRTLRWEFVTCKECLSRKGGAS